MPSNSNTSRDNTPKARAATEATGAKSRPAAGDARAKGADSPASSVSGRSASSATVAADARRSGPPPNRRQSRAWLRAEARRRRNRYISFGATFVVVCVLAALLITH
ncbi:MAG: hypothetical protein ACRDHP_00310, partial [Ktedonobacterales bacterium]